jgi:hypothetical protein
MTLYRFIAIEKQLVATYCIAMVAANFLSLYFILDLFSYDEILGYTPSGEEISCNPRHLGILLLFPCLGNILFISLSLLTRNTQKA